MRAILGTVSGIILGAIALAGPADAAVTLYDFTLDGLTGSPLPSEPPIWGTVSVNDFGGTSHLNFDVKLNSSEGFYFQDSNSFQAFDYLLGGAVSTINITTSGFTDAGLGSYSAPNIIVPSDATLFNYAILCVSACAGGKDDGKISELVFDVTGTNLGIESITDSKNYKPIPIFFGADVAFESTSTFTGNVGATFAASGVPEPATWALFIIGFGAVGGMLRTARRRTAFAAV